MGAATYWGVGCYEKGLGNEEADSDSNGWKSLKCIGMNGAGIRIVLQFGKTINVFEH